MEKYLQFATKRAAVNTDTREIDFIISTDTEDRARDTIAVDGWELEEFKENPVVCWAHKTRDPPIAVCTKIWIENKKLMARAKFADADTYPLADTIYKLLQGGFLNAVSVGFKALEWVWRDDGGIDFIKQVLTEFSVVTVPCNPEALAVARSKGFDVSALADPIKLRAEKAKGVEGARLKAAYLAVTGADAIAAKDVHDENDKLVGKIEAGKLKVDPDYQKDLAQRNLEMIAQRNKELRQSAEKRRREYELALA